MYLFLSCLLPRSSNHTAEVEDGRRQAEGRGVLGPTQSCLISRDSRVSTAVTVISTVIIVKFTLPEWPRSKALGLTSETFET